jgi:hypothetical protein
MTAAARGAKPALGVPDLTRDPAAKRIVSRQHIDNGEADALFELYLAGFDAMRTKAAARHAFSREEFLAELADERIWKHVAHDEGGSPIAMLTLTRHLDAMPWISPEYYAARYPEHFARNAIYYLGFAIVHPDHQGTRALERLLSTKAFIPLAQEKAVMGFDICGYHNGPSGFARHLEAMALRHTPAVTMTPIDTQTYFDFTWT